MKSSRSSSLPLASSTQSFRPCTKGPVRPRYSSSPAFPGAPPSTAHPQGPIRKTSSSRPTAPSLELSRQNCTGPIRKRGLSFPASPPSLPCHSTRPIGKVSRDVPHSLPPLFRSQTTGPVRKKRSTSSSISPFYPSKSPFRFTHIPKPTICAHFAAVTRTRFEQDLKEASKHCSTCTKTSSR